MRRMAGRVASYCCSASKYLFCWISPPPQMMTRLRTGSSGASDVASVSRLIAPIELPTKCAESDVKHLTQARHMPYPHPTAIDEVDYLRRLPEPQHVRRQHSIARGEGGNVTLPTEFGAGTELATVQQHHRVAIAGLQIARGQAVDQRGLAPKIHHLIAIGFTGEPTAPTNLSGGATS